MEESMLTPAQVKAIDGFFEANPIDDFEHMDNHRYATVGNEEQERAYDDARCRGCCGSVDVELDCEDGSKVLFGFNYGH